MIIIVAIIVISFSTSLTIIINIVCWQEPATEYLGTIKIKIIIIITTKITTITTIIIFKND